MLEIRLHGRGGQGSVASAEILAIAAISEGKCSQAFPNFGPERRGAPVTAFFRLDDKPIMLREPVVHPDVVVILDPGVMRVVDTMGGLKPGGKVVVNTCNDPEELARVYGFPACELATVDANEIALRIIGSAITNTAMLGALLRVEPMIKPETVCKVISERFPRNADKNEEAFMTAYREVKIINIDHMAEKDDKEKTNTNLASWKSIDHACIVFEPGNSMELHTGDWRSMRPERSADKCKKCGRCWMYCPDAAVSMSDRGDVEIDYRYCKGCGICARECPYDAISMVEECEYLG